MKKILSDDWWDIKEIIVFGMGRFAEIYIDNLSRFVNIKFIIDNNKEIQGIDYNGIPIYSFNTAKKYINGQKIVICAETLAYNEIKSLLVEHNYEEDKDFTHLEKFICIWPMITVGKLHLMEVHTAVNTICSFNCEKCNMFMTYYKKKENFTLEILRHNIDILFKHVDYIYKYQLVGGEPFLNPDLPAFLEYLADNYKDKIGRLRIITNGSVLPSSSLCTAIKKMNAEVNISDYSCEIAYSEKLSKVINILTEFEIKYDVIPSLKWRDFGFPEKSIIRSKEETIEHMRRCGTSWHGLEDGRLYYCNSGWSAMNAGLIQLSDNEYVDLQGDEEKELTKGKIVDLCLGNLKLGYSEFCQVCGGCGDDNHNFITAGVQRKR